MAYALLSYRLVRNCVITVMADPYIR
jgi:hypothetical protein